MRSPYGSKKMIDKTQKLFEDSILECLKLPEFIELQGMNMSELTLSIRYAYNKLYRPGFYDFSKMKEIVDEIYLAKIISLPTKDLEKILKFHELGSPKRAIRTIEAINSELARRFLIDDYEVADGKIKQHNKKARIKRNKTDKSSSGI
jgi:hypothetical protein